MTMMSARNTGPTSHPTARNPASTRTAAPAPASMTIALGRTGRRRAVVGGDDAAGDGAAGDDRASGITAGASGGEAGAAPPVTGVVMPVTVGSAPRPGLTHSW